jgi:proteic killer suppression protein
VYLQDIAQRNSSVLTRVAQHAILLCKMIKSWKHKGLKRFYTSGDKSGIRPDHAKRLTMILQLLDVANRPEVFDLPGLNFHPLKGKLKNFYALTVRANWRVIFQFDGKDVILVDYLDYH